MNCDTYTFALLILKQYFVKHHYPSELVRVILILYYEDGWIKYDLSECRAFGRSMYVNVSRLGLGMDQIEFKFVLPELPNNLMWKKLCVSDLVKSIRIQIDSPYMFVLQLDSSCLEMFDKVYRDGITIIQKQNRISCIIDSSFFFKESTNTSNFFHILPMGFKGIRLIDCKNQHVVFHLELNEIYRMIDTDYDVRQYADQKILSRLSMKFLGVWCHCVGSNQLIQNKMSISQHIRKLNLWEGKFSVPGNNCKLMITNKQVSKLIFYSQMLDRVGYVCLQIDGRNCMNIIDLKEYKKTYESENNAKLSDNIFIIDVRSNIKCLVCAVWLYDMCNDFKISCIYETKEIGIYENDKFKLGKD